MKPEEKDKTDGEMKEGGNEEKRERRGRKGRDEERGMKEKGRRRGEW